jgi:hypothetical protein
LADIFQCRRGRVVVLKGCEGLPAKLILEDFEPQAAIIVAPSIRQAVNIQFQTSLEEKVYAYAFGDLMGQLELQGTAFAGVCEKDDASGVKDLFDYYKDYKSSKRRETVTATFGSEALCGFLVGLSMTPQDPELMTMNFTLAIAALPKKGGS